MKYLLLALVLTGCQSTRVYTVTCKANGRIVFVENVRKRPGSACYEDTFGYCINLPQDECTFDEL